MATILRAVQSVVDNSMKSTLQQVAQPYRSPLGVYPNTWNLLRGIASAPNQRHSRDSQYFQADHPNGTRFGSRMTYITVDTRASNRGCLTNTN